MGLLDKLFGRQDQPRPRSGYSGYQPGPMNSGNDNEQALERYRYMLRTAPPETIERAHAEAFEKLTPDQRQQVLHELGQVTPPGERVDRDDPRSLARMATRAEIREPGVTERIFGGPAMGGFGTMMAGTIFGSLVAGFVGSMIAQQFFDSVSDDFGGGDWSDQGGHTGGGDFVDSGGSDFGGDFGGDM